MGKMLTQQRRGKGSFVFRSPTHHRTANVRYPNRVYGAPAVGQVISFVDDPGRHALLAELLLDDGTSFYSVAAEGIAIGDRITVGSGGRVALGSILPLSAIPDGMPVFNLETAPKDGGRVARATGSFATVVARDEETGFVNVELSSKKSVSLSPGCFATVGVACGGGRKEKPFTKAGPAHYAAKARGRWYPHVRGTAMNAYDHPHGGRSFGKSTTVSRNAPPGRKVGQVAARSTGRKKSKRAVEEVK